MIRNIQVRARTPTKGVSPTLANTIPGYTITHKLGSGGFATVYKATDDSGREVAIKMPKFIDQTLDSSIYDKFESEAKMWNKLEHKNIVFFYDYNLDPIPSIVMELMVGGSLKELMDDRRLSTQEAMSIFIQLVDAISYAHRMASVHRDIKPENILFTREGIPKLTDWGIGKLMASDSASKTVGAKGTLAYSAPEQISRKKYGMVDWSTDIFQIGIVGYEMLTDYNPFFDDDPVGIMGNIINEEVPPPSKYNPEVTARVDTVILKALEKRKEDRWRSADIMYDRLKQAVS
jgi:serine/threonine-protein kinase